MTTKPDPAAVIANLEVLTNKLCDVFEAKGDYAKAMQDSSAMQGSYKNALTAVAWFLARSGVNEDIAHRFAELATAFDQLPLGIVADFFRPAKVGGRGPDGTADWIWRTGVVIGLDYILRSKKMENREKAAEYIAGNYPIFHRLKRNPRASLSTSILSWQRTILRLIKDNPRASLQKSMPTWQQSVLKAIPRGFFEPHDLPSDEMFDEMFARGERVLAKAAEETLKAAQGRVLTF
jgi:hypothetical protein